MFADFARTPTAQAHVEFAESQAAAAQTMRQDHRGRAVRIDRLSRSPLARRRPGFDSGFMDGTADASCSYSPGPRRG